MRIYIPTLGRIDSQKTWDRIPLSMRHRTFLVCPQSELETHQAKDRNAVPCPAKGISHVRQWLMDKESGKFCMTDDDHYFFRREKINKPKLIVASEEDVEEMFNLVESLLDRFPMVGVSSRQGNDALLGSRKDSQRSYEIEPGLAINKRTCNLYGICAEIFRKEGIRFDAVEVMEDMHVCLSLIAKGYSVGLITEYAWNQVGSGLKGGCSLYRDAELQKKGAIALEKLHRPFVTVVKKESISDNAWNKSVGSTRFDVRVDWTGAVEAAIQSKRKRLF